MHELGIAKDLWAVIEKEAKQRGLKEITGINIAIGEASGIEDHFLRHSFEDHIFPNSIAKDAKLVITYEPLKAKCSSCGIEITKENLKTFRCPGCNGLAIEIITGKECYVKEIQGS